MQFLIQYALNAIRMRQFLCNFQFSVIQKKSFKVSNLIGLGIGHYESHSQSFLGWFELCQFLVSCEGKTYAFLDRS